MGCRWSSTVERVDVVCKHAAEEGSGVFLHFYTLTVLQGSRCDAEVRCVGVEEQV